MPTLRVIGAGRAGLALSEALRRAGWDVVPPLHHTDPVADAAAGIDLLVLAVPDHAIAATAAAVDPDPSGRAVVAHLAGALGLDVLAPHRRVGSLHPMVALPDEVEGAKRLRGAWFAVAGDPLLAVAASDLGGQTVEVADRDRPLHHAAAVIASNHLVALLAGVERIAARAGVPLEAELDLVRATVENVAALGPVRAAAGPVARGDWATVGAHLAALGEDDRPAYVTMAAEAARLAGRVLPAGLVCGSRPSYPRR